MKKNDIFLIFIILLFSAVLFMCRKQETADTVQIYKDNELYAELPLDEDNTVDLDGTNLVAVKGGEVYMECADCPDQICVKQKPLSKDGRDIICLPNSVLVRVTGNNTADAVTG